MADNLPQTALPLEHGTRARKTIHCQLRGKYRVARCIRTCAPFPVRQMAAAALRQRHIRR